MTAPPIPQGVRAPTARRFAAWGALGFGVGGALCGLIQGLLYDPWGQPARDSLVATAGFALMGLLGGAALGLAWRDRGSVRRLAVAGLIGFGPGGLLNLLLIWAAERDLSTAVPVFPRAAGPEGQTSNAGVWLYVAVMYLIAFLVRGVIGGAVLGVAIPHRRAVRFLSLLGGFGFGVGGVVGMVLLNLPWWDVTRLGLVGVHVVWLLVSCTVGGALLGAGTGSLARRILRGS